MQGRQSTRADRAICAECIGELSDPKGRRFRYVFIHCDDCGPCFTLATARGDDDEEREPCIACRTEAEEPSSRRFAALSISCERCGPTPILRQSSGGEIRGERALDGAIRLLHEGKIVAIKGTGGFLLAVDAGNEEAVATLRQRKHRPHKPFAVMARDVSWAERIVRISADDVRRLHGPERPILLLPTRDSREVAASVAPGLGDLGVFLPSNGLQHLLLREGPPLLVMTSGNLSGEPVAATNEEGLRLLGAVADAVLLHDRSIRNAADDSVFRASREGPIPIRRSRGFVPEALALPDEAPPLLAVGGQEKNTLCLASGGRAILSAHHGDLDALASWERFLRSAERLLNWTDWGPVAVAHDLHPDYRSTRWALEIGLPRVEVQHHHAHVAAVLAERGEEGPAIGVAFDGTGYGSDHTLWGGEFFVADCGDFQRLGHLASIPLPGGSRAIREPWRLGVAARWEAGLEAESPGARQIVDLLRAELSISRSTGAGRWFDAVAALCGVCPVASYEGQAAAELEARVQPGPADPYRFDLRSGTPFVVDLRQTILEIDRDRRAGVEVPRIASRFHETIAQVIRRGCNELRERSGLGVVALAGGCFQNRILVERSAELLRGDGFRVLLPIEVPANDGGLSYGQAVVAARRLANGGASHVSRHTG